MTDFGWEVKRSVRWRTANARGMAPGRPHISSLPLAREVSRLPVTPPTDIRAEKWEFGSGSLVAISGHFGYTRLEAAVWFRRRRQHPSSPPPRLARVRPEYASLYPRLRADRWAPVRQVLRRARLDPAGLRKADGHFEFQGGQPPRNPACRFLRQRFADPLPR